MRHTSLIVFEAPYHEKGHPLSPEVGPDDTRQNDDVTTAGNDGEPHGISDQVIKHIIVARSSESRQ